MLLEKILFNVVAISLLIVIFAKIIRKNDTNYISIMVLQCIGIAICFLELKLGIADSILLLMVRYLFSVLIPALIIGFEFKGVNFSEFISIMLARLFYKLGNNKKAKEILVNLTNRYEYSYLGHKLLAEIYEKEGGMRKSIDEYVKAIDIKKNDTKSYFKIAKLLNELDQKDQAIEMLQNLLKTQPNYYDATMLLGEMYCEQERFKEAASVYLDGLKYRALDFEIYYNLGIVYTRLNDFSQAQEMYQRAAEINSMLCEAHYNMALIALIQEDLEKAEEYFEKCLYDDELEADAYYNLAKIALLKGDKAKALTFLNKAIEIQPDLLDKANRDRAFDSIKQYITVSVKMDDEYRKDKKKKSKFSKKFLDTKKYLENTKDLVGEIVDNTKQQKIAEKVNLIIDAERLRQEQEKDSEVQEQEKEPVIEEIKEKNSTNEE